MEIILSNCKNHPSCPHGPCLLFERYTSDGSKTGRRFFACSACRDRKECSFFQWADDEIPKEKKKRWQEIILTKRPPYSHEECNRRLEVFKTLPVDERKYCKTCSMLILNELEKHPNHNIIDNISLQDIFHPTSLFELHENKKVEAQYFFSKSTINFVVSVMKDLGFSKVVSIGVPKIHEYVINNQNVGLSSFLMDIDYRYVQYDNHKKFGKTKAENSPVRIFTNIEASHFVLPTECGYRFCDKCKRYVSEENQHCSKCNACTTKHGKTYQHCDDCQQCVKPSYVHCLQCNKCGPNSSDMSKICKNCKCDGLKDDQVKQNKCFTCNGIGHRKRNCPEGLIGHNKRRRVKKT